MSDRILLKAASIGLNHHVEDIQNARSAYERALSEYGIDGARVAMDFLRAAVRKLDTAVARLDDETDRQMIVEQDAMTVRPTFGSRPRLVGEFQ